jgi:hypothetical protein
MPSTYIDELFKDLRSRDEPIMLEDLSFIRCTFLGCSLRSTDVSRRARIRRVSLSGCEVVGESSRIRGAIVEDCTIDELKTGGLLHLDGCAFKHVLLRGAIGRVLLTNRLIHDPRTPKETEQPFIDANSRYYMGVDWALDISEAMSTELDIRGIPGRLIRRNPETQVLFRRERLLDGDWERLALDSLVRYWLAYLFEMGWEDGIFVVPTRGKRRREMMESMLTLRREGIAEPD